MNSITTLLNLGNSDYQNNLLGKKNQNEEALAAAKEKLAQDRLEKQLLSQQLQETADNQQVVRRMHQVEQEIQKLSLAQAQMMLEVVTQKIGTSSSMQLQQMQIPGERGLLSPAYV